MRENQLSRYGAISKFLQYTTGKVFIVKQSTDSDYENFQASFPADGDGVERVYSTIQSAVTAASINSPIGAVILVMPGEMSAGATDPTSYAENVIVPAGMSNLSIIGVQENRTQGGLPQIKKGSGSLALFTVRSPGTLIKNIGFNGAGSTGGGILLDDDASTKSAFGTAIIGCHFKNCKGSTATNAATGGAIQWSSNGGAWQVLIKGNRFYNNVGDVVLLGTGVSVPQDVVIEDNVFGGGAANDCSIYLAAGSGVIGLVIRNNNFGNFPILGSGSNLMYVKLTGCTGTIASNMFGCTGKTFGAGADVVVPTTVLMSGNYQESGLIARS